ncbi:hypothetical protein [Natronosalvus rutilus]|uniref:Uncharacterized protein n=1 Tax=Natronosalvus rutilus TaxID=2953753 RepID=A0A9E7SW00_9EURY|nr:hypothetical protein [Natronosalvus rutilus]UTF52753.1 hypothetical protein NGM29_13300 [Natronosalvus rutilus]
MSTDTTNDVAQTHVESPDDLVEASKTDFADSALIDFNIYMLLMTACGFLGGVLFTAGWFGVSPLVEYIPQAGIGALAVVVSVGGPLGIYLVLRSDYPDVFGTLRQIPSRINNDD